MSQKFPLGPISQSFVTDRTKPPLLHVTTPGNEGDHGVLLDYCREAGFPILESDAVPKDKEDKFIRTQTDKDGKTTFVVGDDPGTIRGLFKFGKIAETRWANDEAKLGMVEKLIKASRVRQTHLSLPDLRKLRVTVPKVREVMEKFERDSGLAAIDVKLEDYLVALPAVDFVVGDDGSAYAYEKPAHRVITPAMYDLGEVWNSLYRAITGGKDPSNEVDGAARFNGSWQPVINVTWHDARNVEKEMNNRYPLPGLRWRIPSETERRRLMIGMHQEETDEVNSELLTCMESG